LSFGGSDVRTTRRAWSRGIEGVLLLLAILFPQAGANAQCPTVTLYCDGDYCGGASEQSFDVAQGSLACEGGTTSFNLISGALEARAQSPCTYGFTSADARDAYRIDGLPAGSQVTFMARLIVSATGCKPAYGGGSSSAEISDGVSFDVVEASPSGPYDSGCVTVADSAQITLTRTVGEPFVLRFKLQAGGIDGGSGHVTALVRFGDLPSGAVVTSCYGYRQEGATPVAVRTWGGVKALYRD
jgi:hypothetical protein